MYIYIDMSNSTTTILTPCSFTEIPLKGRWANALYVREYQRLKRREKYPPKQLRLNDDGTERQYITNTYNYYKPRERRFCDLCMKSVFEGQWVRHIEGTQHQKEARRGLTVPSPCLNYPR